MTEDESNLIEFARGYFANDFPNPKSRGCPSRASLAELSDSRKLPDPALRAHLLGCSNCFEYLNARLSSRPEEVELPARWRTFVGSLVSAWRPLMAAAAVIVVLCGGLWTLWPRWAKPPVNTAHSPSPPVEEVSDGGNVNAAAAPFHTPAPPGPVAGHTPHNPAADNKRRGGSKPEEPEVYLVRIDLSERYVLRGADDTAGKEVIRVRPTINSLSITLPNESQRGAYTVSLVDAFGNAVITRRAVSRDGKEISLRMDMRGLTPLRYRLCVSQAEGLPSCLPLSVTGGR